MGRHTKYGGYVVEWKKVRTYVVPANLKDFTVSPSTNPESPVHMLTCLQLTPFVTQKMEKTRGRFEGQTKGGFSGQRYLERWKVENGED